MFDKMEKKKFYGVSTERNFYSAYQKGHKIWVDATTMKIVRRFLLVIDFILYCSIY